MIIPETYEDLYVVGDIHGEFRELVFNLTEKYSLENSVIVVAGDVGLGFESPRHYNNLYDRISKRLEKHNLLILGVRGNHDDPEYFNGQLRLDYPRLKTLPDYSAVRMKDKEILVIGGATSIDQSERIASGKENVWWPNEEPIRLTETEIQRLSGREYCIISHEAPISFLPVITKTEVYDKVIGVRRYLEEILWRCKPYRWYYGHYHHSYSESNGVTRSRCLDIQELIRVPLEEDYEIKKMGS